MEHGYFYSMPRSDDFPNQSNFFGKLNIEIFDFSQVNFLNPEYMSQSGT